MRSFMTMFSIIAAVSAITPAFADNIDDAIKARQSFYQVVKHNAGALFGMAKGDVEYDAEKASAHANNLKALSHMNNSSVWLPGSSKADHEGKTRALPAIWTTYPAIVEKDIAFKDATVALATSAGDGLDKLRANIGALGASCKGCHETYRAKNF